MNINEFAEWIAEEEKGEKEIDIAQIKQILKIINRLLKGIPYILIKWWY